MSEDMRLLFRFRDLVAETIKSHQDVIKETGFCWWGWWKRPSAPVIKLGIWQSLLEATEDKPIAVGLFNSGTGTVFRALVIDVIPPNEDGSYVEPPMDILSIPAYYRDSARGNAWLKIKKISPIDNFYGNYSFSSKPDATNYTSDLLQRFVGKKISGKDELSAMDTNVWEIRPSEENDASEDITLSSHTLSSAVTGGTVRLKSNRILHITDLHFSTENTQRSQHLWRLESEQDKIENSLSAALHSTISKEPIGAIIITGDITYIGSPDEFKEARSFISKILSYAKLNEDNLIIIPGNHDICWSSNDVYSPGAPIEAAPKAAKQNYEEFYRALFHHDPSPHLAMGRRWLLPCGLTLEIGALNSTSLKTGKNFLAGMGRVDEASFEEISNGLDWRSNSGNAQPTLALRIIALHHHLTVTEDIESADGYAQGFGMAVDAVRIQRFAAKHRVQLALHGHKHRAFLWRSSIYDLPEHASKNYKLGEISIIGGGSAGSCETESESNYFNILELSPAELKVDIYKSRSKGVFENIKTFSAPLARFDDGGLKLEDWKFIG